MTRAMAAVFVGMVVALGAACLPLQLGGALIARAGNSATAEARMRAQSERTRQAARADEGREDWPCPPSCQAGFTCVHLEKVDRAVCRPACDAANGCSDGSTCIALAPGNAVCLVRAFIDGARLEPLQEFAPPPPPLLDEDAAR